MASTVLTDRFLSSISLVENGGRLLIGCCHIRIGEQKDQKYNIVPELFQSDSWGWTDTVHI